MQNQFMKIHGAALAGCVLVGGLFASHAHTQVCSPAEITKLVAPDTATRDYFGYSLGVSGDVAVVGARDDDDFGSASGSASVFRFDGTQWVYETKLVASDAQAYDFFGHAVAISGDVIVVGSDGDDDGGTWSGSAYVYRWNGTQWIEEAKLVAADASELNVFGYSVAIEGNTIVVGARWDDVASADSGSVYVFGYNGVSWAQHDKLVPAPGVYSFEFGESVAISGDAIIVGAPQDNYSQNQSGSAYIFRFDGNMWVQQNRLLPLDRMDGDEFGLSVSISGDTAIIGSNAASGVGTRSGAAYAYTFDGAQWKEDFKFVPSDTIAGQRFGWGVAVLDNIAVIGAPYDDTTGSAYVYRHDGTQWIEDAKLFASDGYGGLLGSVVAISGDTAHLGAHGHGVNGYRSGASYIFDLGCSAQACPADLTGDGLLNFFDVSAFLNAFGTGDPAADFTGDGFFNFFDVSAFLNGFAAGCP